MWQAQESDRQGGFQSILTKYKVGCHLLPLKVLSMRLLPFP